MHVVKNTQFHCKICDQVVEFDRNDPNSYLSKEIHQQFFGMSLITYRVIHGTPSERHVNVILVDDAGYYRGHVDAYMEPIQQVVPSSSITPQFHLLSESATPREFHGVFRVLFVMNLKDMWVLDLVVPSNVDVISLAKVVYRNVMDAKVIYKTVPEQMNITVADLTIHLWIKHDLAIAASLATTNHLSLEFIDTLFHHVLVLQQKLDSLSGERPFRESFNALLAILHCPNLSPSEVTILTRILVDHLFHARVELRYKKHWPLIKKRLIREFPNLEAFFDMYLTKETSIIEILKNDQFSCLFREIIDAVDFINRRNLLDMIQ